MTRTRSSLRSTIAFAVVAALTTEVTLLTWSSFAEDSSEYLGPLFTLALLIALSGSLLRWLRAPEVLVVAIQVLLSGSFVIDRYRDGAGWRPLPTPTAIEGFVEGMRGALHSASTYAAPIDSRADSVAPLLLLCGAAALVAMDFVAVGLNRVPASGLVLLMIYTLPVTVWNSSIPGWVFAGAAAGFMVMLFLREDDRFNQWGRPINRRDGDDPVGFGVRTGSARATATRAGITATAFALILPLFIPTLSLEVFTGRGGGSGVRIVDPMVDLRRDLRQGRDVPLVEVTSPEDPSYLRIAALTTFNGEEWTTGRRTIPNDQVSDGTPLPLNGVASAVPRREFPARYRTTDDFDSAWLPAPYPAASVTAAGNWKYDVDTLDFIAGETDLSAADLDYTATGLELDYDPVGLARAPESDPNATRQYIDTFGVTEEVRQLAKEVTKGYHSTFARAARLQQWFRSPEAGFTYDTANAPVGNGNNALDQFLFEGPEGRIGYCEQYASAMAIMARTLGIPARVAIGFLHPERTGNDSWQFSTRDMHAWPEISIPGYGWVRFDPTPASYSGAGPAYTRGEIPDEGATNEPSNGASQTLPDRGQLIPSGKTASPNAEGSGAADDPGFPWVLVLVGLVVLVLLATAMLLPRTLRRARRESRWHAGTAEAAWAELRDVARDLRVPWPDGRSPRATAAVVAAHFAADGELVRPERGPEAAPEATAALERLVLALERERYAEHPEATDVGQLRNDVVSCVAALRAGVSDRQRRTADWLPASLGRQGFASGASRTTRAGDDTLARVESRSDSDQVREEVSG